VSRLLATTRTSRTENFERRTANGERRTENVERRIGYLWDVARGWRF
jgi:hypothetical protein